MNTLKNQHKRFHSRRGGGILFDGNFGVFKGRRRKGDTFKKRIRNLKKSNIQRYEKGIDKLMKQNFDVNEIIKKYGEDIYNDLQYNLKKNSVEYVCDNPALRESLLKSRDSKEYKEAIETLYNCGLGENITHSKVQQIFGNVVLSDLIEHTKKEDSEINMDLTTADALTMMSEEDKNELVKKFVETAKNDYNSGKSDSETNPLFLGVRNIKKNPPTQNSNEIPTMFALPLISQGERKHTLPDIDYLTSGLPDIVNDSKYNGEGGRKKYKTKNAKRSKTRKR